MGATTHTDAFDAATDAELQRLEDDAAAAVADSNAERSRYRCTILAYESEVNRGTWNLSITYTDDCGNEDKTTRTRLSVSDVARTIAQELDNA